MLKKTLFLSFIVAFGLQTQAQSGKLTIEGDIPKSVELNADQLKSMPHITLKSNDMQGKNHEYSGVAVADILKSAGVIAPAFNRDNLTKYVLVRSSDNYQVLFSLSELDSAFSGRTVILADMVDGQPLPLAKGPYKIVIPGEEKRQARSIWGVTTFVIRNSKD